jgi:hypothetical protein
MAEDGREKSKEGDVVPSFQVYAVEALEMDISEAQRDIV